MYVRQFFVEGLGHASYLVGSEEPNEAAVVDPRRDIDVYIEEARRQGLRIRYVLETHIHNDFLSGAKQLSEVAHAEHLASAEAGLQFPFHHVTAGDEIRMGELLIRVLATPGHTPEHVTYVVVDTSRSDLPVLAFTGGDLLVGGVGRPDLLGKELGEKLAPMLYDGLHDKILKLEDFVEVMPTHGAGSLCGRGMSSKRTSTIGYERRANPALQIQDKDAFVRYVLSGNPGIPTYYRRMRPANQRGPTDWRLAEPQALTTEEVQHLARHGALILDTMPNVAFGGGHIPGAINFGWDPLFVTWVGWLVPSDVPLVLVLEQPDQWAAVVTALARIGYDEVLGYLQGGMATWINSALPVDHVAQRSVHELKECLERDHLPVLDVRTDAEWNSGHIEGATHVSLDQLEEHIDEIRQGRPLAVVCGGGYRSSIATSILQKHGFRDLVNILGGMGAWNKAKYPTVKGRVEEKPAEYREAA